MSIDTYRYRWTLSDDICGNANDIAPRGTLAIREQQIYKRREDPCARTKSRHSVEALSRSKPRPAPVDPVAGFVVCDGWISSEQTCPANGQHSTQCRNGRNCGANICASIRTASCAWNKVCSPTRRSSTISGRIAGVCVCSSTRRISSRCASRTTTRPSNGKRSAAYLLAAMRTATRLIRVIRGTERKKSNELYARSTFRERLCALRRDVQRSCDRTLLLADV